MWTTAPKARVDMTKKEPLRRMVMAPKSAAEAALIAAPSHIPMSGLTPAFRNNRLEAYAPIPKNAEWPRESWPA
jgi:hypothetical protein